MEDKIAIGIDLGTTYSCVGIYKNDTVEIIPNINGERTTPSWVSFTEDERIIGSGAKAASVLNAENTIYDVKRLMGKKYSDATVKQIKEHLSYKIIPDQNDKIKIEVFIKGEKKIFSPEEISAMILEYMKKSAEAYLGHTVKKAVITCPAYFNDAQRQATKDAGAIAGLEVLRIINEPTAAAISFGLDKIGTEKKEKTIIIIDTGGGTHDISCLTLDNGIFEVNAVGGNNFLGGEDIDNRLTDYCIQEFQKEHHVDFKEATTNTMRKIRTRLHLACEKAKRALSTSPEAIVELDSLYKGIDCVQKISRAKFEVLCMDLFELAIKPIDQVLKDAKKSKADIDEVVLVGGSTRIPKLQEMLANYFGISVNKLCKSVNPDEAVAFGAAVQGAVLTKQKSEKIDALLLMDVIPLSLGVETSGEMMTVLIKRNTPKPTKKTDVFSTYRDDQDTVTIKVYEGERQFTKDCNLLGQFDLTGIPPMSRGQPKIEITFDIDADGILNVSAVEKSTGKSKNIKIKNDKGRLTTEEIDRMIHDAEKYREEDDKNKSKVDSKLGLMNYVYSIKQCLKDNKVKEKLSVDEIKNIETKITEIEQYIQENRTEEEYNSKKEELEHIFSPIIQKLGSKDNTTNDGTSPQHNETHSTTKNNTTGPRIEEVD